MNPHNYPLLLPNTKVSNALAFLISFVLRFLRYYGIESLTLRKKDVTHCGLLRYSCSTLGISSPQYCRSSVHPIYWWRKLGKYWALLPNRNAFSSLFLHWTRLCNSCTYKFIDFDFVPFLNNCQSVISLSEFDFIICNLYTLTPMLAGLVLIQ